jgi:hypothetical protein
LDLPEFVCLVLLLISIYHRDPKYRERMFENFVDKTSLSFSAGELLS